MLGLIWDAHRKAKSRYRFFRRKHEQRQERVKQKVVKTKKRKGRNQ